MPIKDPELRKKKQAEYHRTWYSKNRKSRSAEVLARKTGIRDWFQEYKSTLKCLKCPENHTACLEFHQRDSEQKDGAVASFWVYGWSIKRILEEISKCDVLCANCHRKLHHKTFGA